MKKQSSLALVLIFSFIIPVAAQNQNPRPAGQTNPQQTQRGDDDDVVRITTNLVQVDAVVTDKKGKLVTDLKPEEFEIYEDNRQQKITNFSFVSTENEAAPAQPVAEKPSAPVDKTAPPVPPVRLRPEQIRRTIAVVVDDLGLSFTSTAYVRQALKKFVEKQVEPGDLVAIIRTAGGIGALQQFTSDKRQLNAAVDRVKWNPTGRGGISAFAPIDTQSVMNDGGSVGSTSSGSEDLNQANEDLNQFREELFSVGTLGAINYVVRGMRQLPGRKSILLISDGIKIFNTDDPTRSTRVLDALRSLTDLANRASVVIYTMDARGLVFTGITAADGLSALPTDQLQTLGTNDPLASTLPNRDAELFESQNGLNYLAQQTGGMAIRNTNDLSAGINRVLEDQRGYYLIGYRPDESTFDPRTGRRRFHKILIKVKRPGLRVRSRTGFYGITNEEALPERRTPAQQLVSALTSPFAESGIRLRLTSLFGNDPKEGSFVRSLLHIAGSDLTFTDEPDGWHKAVFDVLAVTFGDNGRVIDQVARTQTMRVRGETYKRFLESGIVYILTVPIKKPGAYQLRTAIRDESSEHVGSASQFIEVPNIGKNRLAVSGVTVSGVRPAARVEAKGAEPNAQAAPGAPQQEVAKEGVAETDPQSSPAVRRFRQRTQMQYAYLIYNAQLDKATGRPQLQTQVRLFRDGNQIFTGRVASYEPGAQTDLKRLWSGGIINLGTDLAPGEYVLQVIVTDLLAKEKYRTATQWIDFEIVK